MKTREYDHLTGITTTLENDAQGTIHIARTADVQTQVDFAKSLANDRDYSQRGIKQGMWHYAHIPNIVMEQMIQHGIDVYGPGAGKAIAKYINEHAPYLKTTDKRHA